MSGWFCVEFVSPFGNIGVAIVPYCVGVLLGLASLRVLALPNSCRLLSIRGCASCLFHPCDSCQSHHESCQRRAPGCCPSACQRRSEPLERPPACPSACQRRSMPAVCPPAAPDPLVRSQTSHACQGCCARSARQGGPLNGPAPLQPLERSVAALGLLVIEPARRLHCPLPQPRCPAPTAWRNAEADLHGPMHVLASTPQIGRAHV